RRLVLVLIGLVVVVGIGVLAARYYLKSTHVTAQVASRLQEVYGGPVQVEDADIGVTGSSLHGLRLFETDPTRGQVPWVEVGTIQADISLWDVLRGTALPHLLTLQDASLTLRFDKDGKLLTQLPPRGGETQTLPEIRLEKGRLTLQQEGR